MAYPLFCLLRRLPLLSLLLLLSSGDLAAQLLMEPREMTNRPLGLPGDASSLAWNPGVLGMSGEVDLVAGVGYDTSFSESATTFGLFGAWKGLGLGLLGGALDQPDPLYYAGFGVRIRSDLPLWAGASVTIPEGAFFKETDFMIGLVAEPLDRLLLGLTADAMMSDVSQIRVATDLAWNPASWVGLRGGLMYDPRVAGTGQNEVSSNLGLDFYLFERVVALSSTFDVDREELRFGVELLFGEGLIVGSFNDITLASGNTGYRGGTGIVRYRPVETDPYVEEGGPRGGGPVPTVRRGWAPERSYAPEGLDYRYAVSDATPDPLALKRPCDVSPSGFDTPSELYETVISGGTPYAPLAEALKELGDDPANLFKNIRRTFYSQAVRSSELMSGDSLAITNLQGYSIGVQRVDNAAFPLVSVYMQVTDAEGRTVRGLGTEDFAFTDPSIEIVSVRPIDSTRRLPVDVTLLVDCSGSMQQEIEAVRANAQSFVDHMEASGADYRIGGVLYGSLIYDTLHPTSDFTRFREFISNAAAIGGDEISTLAVQAATEMTYRPDAQRIFILVTDDWVVQQNAKLTETDLVGMLWDTRARLYQIANRCKNNAAVATRLTLGNEYDIRTPFNFILDDIGTDITTTYELLYRSKMKEVPKVTILRGHVRDELGRVVGGATIELDPATGSPVLARSNQTTGEYEVVIEAGERYGAEIAESPYLPFSDRVDASRLAAGDTIVRDFLLMLPETTLRGQILDEDDRGVPGSVQIDDAATLETVLTVTTDPEGRYRTPLKEGRVYRLTPVVPEHLPTPVELDTRKTPKGTELVQDLRVMSIDHALVTGATFRLNNIFFDFDKDVLKDESIPELQKLIRLMNEYPSIRVEIGAHTDAEGSDAYNVDLSQRRARSVVTYLVSEGITPSRLLSRGYGETTPIATNETDEGRALNRRVEFRLIR